jgi:DNA-binding GntR family transcriptional regulator
MSGDIIRKEARLIILRELFAQSNYALNDSLLQQTLETWGIAKSREWVREELSWLANMGAVRLVAPGGGNTVIATLVQRGIEHVERRQPIEGVKRMSPPEG